MPHKPRHNCDPNNTTREGDYVVGKGKPPEHGKFRKGDGRKRGRRPKGTNNLATDLREELGSRVSVAVGGVAKTVTRQRAVVMRMADNATKGSNPAIALILNLQQRLVDPLFESEQQQQRRELRLSCLTDVELDVLIHLESKMLGLEDEISGIVGFIPIMKEDPNQCGKNRRAVISTRRQSLDQDGTDPQS